MGKYKHWAVFNIDSLDEIKDLPEQLKEKSVGAFTPITCILVNVSDADDRTEAFNLVSKMFPEYSVNVGVIPKHDL